jgi:hypothetical protein
LQVLIESATLYFQFLPLSGRYSGTSDKGPSEKRTTSHKRHSVLYSEVLLYLSFKQYFNTSGSDQPPTFFCGPDFDNVIAMDLLCNGVDDCTINGVINGDDETAVICDSELS